ncbi:MAG: metallophosphoesterase [Verrucomicrobiae bacterium]|nr:metallophosphoesterase [Verrucomicrobiae bacterium]
MPAEFSRRRLIALGTAGLALPRNTWAVETSGRSTTLPDKWPDFSFLVVTDTHLGYQNKASAAQQWEKTATELAQAEGDFILHLGDVVDQGQEPQYPIYRKIRDSIGKPVHEIPGNHDPIDLFEKHLEITTDRSFDHGGVRFVLFGNAHRDSHDGFITEEQLIWIGQQCQEATEKNLWLVLCAHVPCHTNKPPDRAWYVKPENGQTRFYEILDQHRGRVLVLFHGHFHNGIRGWDDRSPLNEVLFPSALYNQKRGLMEKNAPGYNLEEFRPGYVAATFSEGSLTLDYWPVGTDEKMSKRLRYPDSV